MRVALAVLLLAACLAGCARLERDPLASYTADPDAFSVPLTTFATIPF